MDKSLDWVHVSVDRSGALGPPWTDAVWTVGTSACSPELGLRPLRCAEAHRRGRKMERGARGARLGPHLGSSGVEEDGRQRGRLGGVGAR
jgi:hypothetical protein